MAIGATTLQVETGKGVLFPTPDDDEIFIFTIEDLALGYREICYCTARTADALTIERAREGTTARAWTASTNAYVQHRVTAGTLERLQEAGAEEGGGGGITVLPCEFQLSCSNLTDDLAAVTNAAYFRAPFAFELQDVRASLLTAAASGTVTVDINVNGSTILSTKLTIDATETTSETATTPAVISAPAITDDDEIKIDIDDAGTSAAGLIVTLIGERD